MKLFFKIVGGSNSNKFLKQTETLSYKEESEKKSF